MSKEHVVRALVIVNLQVNKINIFQNDYFPGGSIPIKDAEEIIPVINQLRRKDFDYTIILQLWHPVNHWYILLFFLVHFHQIILYIINILIRDIQVVRLVIYL